MSAIQFILDEDQRDLWTHEVAPKVATCVGKEKVKEPCWTTIRENVSFILSDSGADGTTECLLSFWGEPFMARSTERDVPRYIFRVQGHSELVARLVELERSYRFST